MEVYPEKRSSAITDSTTSTSLPTENEEITAIEFSKDGQYLAVGDAGGHIALLKADTQIEETGKSLYWAPWHTFRSHEKEFDYLKSLDIEAKINQLKFCPANGGSALLISSNDKTIKLWKVQERLSYKSSSAVRSLQTRRSLRLPEIDHTNQKQSPKASLNRTYSNAHTYHINSLSLNSDMETFYSADDLRVNLWRLEDSSTAYNIIDIKPENMEDLTEVITALRCHPTHCNILAYSSSKGCIKLCDTRKSALCFLYSKVFSDQASPRNSTSGNKSFISDILNSISDISYSSDGKYIVSRDYLSIKIWDTTMERRPVKTIMLHEYLRPLLYELYTSDSIFDKFEARFLPIGNSIITGSYSNQLKICHQDDRGMRNVDLPQLMDDTSIYPHVPLEKLTNEQGKNMDKAPKGTAMRGSRLAALSEVVTAERVLHCAPHPTDNIFAVAGKAGVCMYKV